MNLSSWKLLPAHWLLNAGILGLLDVLERQGKISLDSLLERDGSLNGFRLYRIVRENLDKSAPVPPEIEPLRRLQWWYIQHERDLHGTPTISDRAPFTTPEGQLYYAVCGRLFGNQGDYRNLFHHTKRNDVGYFAQFFGVDSIFARDRHSVCPISGVRGFKLREVEFKWLKWAFPNYENFPNAFRGALQESGALKLSSPMLHVTLFHHFTLVPLRGGIKAFINAPSFELMYHLNRLLRALAPANDAPQMLLASSMIGYAVRLQRMLSAWSYQNIELILLVGDKVESHSLPPDVARLLMDQKIARALHHLKSPRILSLFLSRRFGELEELAYRILRHDLKGQEAGKADKELIKDFFSGGSLRHDALSNLLTLTTRIREIMKPVHI